LIDRDAATGSIRLFVADNDWQCVIYRINRL